MLPPQHRLPLRTDLVRVQKQGKLFHSRLFSLLLAKKENQEPSRFGFIISTRVDKKAVKRNRARRLLIESIRTFLPALKPGFEGVFLAKRNLIDKKLPEVKKEVGVVFEKAGLK